MKKVNIRLFSHNDLDGYGCNIVLEGLGINYKATNSNYRELDSLISEYIETKEYKNYSITLITDVFPGKHIMEKLNKLNKEGHKVFMLDHHIESLHYNKYSWVISEVSKYVCGTKLLYNFLTSLIHNNSKTLHQVVNDIRDYDTWRWEEVSNSNAKKLNTVFNSMEDKEQFVKELANTSTETMLKAHQSLIESYNNKIDKLVDEVLKSSIETKLEGLDVKVSEMEYTKDIKEIGYRACRNIKEDLLVILVNNVANLFTAKDSVDCGEIAREFKGKGYTKYARFNI